MSILYQPQWWLRGLAGGALIGGSAAAMMAFNGRVAGISGIVGGLALERGRDRLWRALFVGGLLAGALLANAMSLGSPVTISAGPAQILIGGLLVGFGTRLGNGCTSGHGVCGLARFSRRSAAATATFMALGFATVFVMRHGAHP